MLAEQTLQAHSGPDQVFMSLLKVDRFSAPLISVGKLFQILGPKDLKGVLVHLKLLFEP